MTTNGAWLDRLLAIECTDATYPVALDSAPLVFDRARGSRISDVEGNCYLDLCAGFGALALGHNHPSVMSVFQQYVSAVASGMPPIMHAMGDVYPSRAKIELIETLRELLPRRLSRISLAISGGQAVEVALKSAMLHSGSAGFITFKDGYHGVDLGVLPVTSRPDFKEPFAKYLSQSLVMELPYGCAMAEISSAVRQLRKMPCGFAGIIVEPVQGRGGVVVPPSGWLQSLGQMAHEHGGVLILDEILTGLGRRGKWTEAEQVDADLVCFGKALGGGMPLSACAGTEKVMSAWPQSTGEAIHTGTFFGHPLSCLVAAAGLREMQNIDICQQARESGEWLNSQLQAAFKNHKNVHEIRWGGGLMFAIQFSDEVGLGAGARAMDRLRGARIIALASGANGMSLSLTPALNISRDELTEAIAVLASVI